RALSPLALHGPLARGEVGLHDLGDAETLGEDLEGGQSAAAALTSAALDRAGARLTVVLGGGHETAWSSYLGLVGSGLGPRAGQRWGVLNLDAHFDLREEARPTSGTPFAQMAAAEQQVGRELHYAVLGIAEPSNTGALFDRDRELGVRWWTDEQCLEAGAAGVARFVEEFAAELAVHYLTNDLDVLPAAVAPGVSAPAAYGVPLPLVAAAVRAAARSGTLTLLDVVELNPSLDIDGRTARAAARLIDRAARTACGAAACAARLPARLRAGGSRRGSPRRRRRAGRRTEGSGSRGGPSPRAARPASRPPRSHPRTRASSPSRCRRRCRRGRGGWRRSRSP